MTDEVAPLLADMAAELAVMERGGPLPGAGCPERDGTVGYVSMGHLKDIRDNLKTVAGYLESIDAPEDLAAWVVHACSCLEEVLGIEWAGDPPRGSDRPPLGGSDEETDCKAICAHLAAGVGEGEAIAAPDPPRRSGRR